LAGNQMGIEMLALLNMHAATTQMGTTALPNHRTTEPSNHSRIQSLIYLCWARCIGRLLWPPFARCSFGHHRLWLGCLN